MATTVSIPPHLHASLVKLIDPPILPDDLSISLSQCVKPSIAESSKEISYDLLRRISHWVKTPEGSSAIKAKELNQYDYSMIALLAGTTTSPSAKLPPYRPPLTPEEIAILRSKEKKAISALLNGFLSVIGVGVAGWWAGGSIGMPHDQRTLLAVFSAVVVAGTEAVLYWIWSWRYHKALKGTKYIAEKKRDPMPTIVVPVASSGDTQPLAQDGLRHRPPLKADEDAS